MKTLHPPTKRGITSVDLRCCCPSGLSKMKNHHVIVLIIRITTTTILLFLIVLLVVVDVIHKYHPSYDGGSTIFVNGFSPLQYDPMKHFSGTSWYGPKQQHVHHQLSLSISTRQFHTTTRRSSGTRSFLHINIDSCHNLVNRKVGTFNVFRGRKERYRTNDSFPCSLVPLQMNSLDDDSMNNRVDIEDDTDLNQNLEQQPISHVNNNHISVSTPFRKGNNMIKPKSNTTRSKRPARITKRSNKQPLLKNGAQKVSLEITTNEQEIPYSSETEMLWSYVHSIQRMRNEMNGFFPNSMEEHSSTSPRRVTHSPATKEYLLKPVRSLLGYLTYNKCNEMQDKRNDLIHQEETNFTKMTTLESEVDDPLHRSIIQGIRLAASLNDYRLIVHLIDAVKRYVTASPVIASPLSKLESNNQGLSEEGVKPKLIRQLDPRIMGEAIRGLSQTSIHVSKIRTLWSLNFGEPFTYFGEPSSMEINFMLQALVKNGKIRAALNLFHHYNVYSNLENVPLENKLQRHLFYTDSYSLSILLIALKESVMKDSSKLHQKSKSIMDPSNLPPLFNLDILQPTKWLSTTCWQWNEAIRLIDCAVSELPRFNSTNVTNSRRNKLNNQVITALLQFNRHLTDQYGIQYHNGPMHALNIVHFLKTTLCNVLDIDEITFTLLISNLGKQHYQVAIHLLEESTKQFNERYNDERNIILDNDENVRNLNGSKWNLPSPNNYVYASVMAVCAQSRQYDLALKLLDNVYNLANDSLNDKHRTTNGINDPPQFHLMPTTWMFNSVLQALHKNKNNNNIQKNTEEIITTKVNSNKKANRMAAKLRMDLAFDLLIRMENNKFKTYTKPDAVTYNTVLSVMASVQNYLLDESFWKSLSDSVKSFTNGAQYGVMKEDDNHKPKELYLTTTTCSSERLLNAILDVMQHESILTDSVTYRYAFKVLWGSDRNAVLRLLDRALREIETRENRRIVMGSMTIDDVYKECLICLTNSGSVDGILQVATQMLDRNVQVNTNTIVSYVLKALEIGHETNIIPIFLLAIAGDAPANKLLLKTHSISLDHRFILSKSLVTINHYSISIRYCLRRNDFKSAHRVLILMQQSGIRPSDNTLEEIATSYATIALSPSVEPTNGAASGLKSRRMKRSVKNIKTNPAMVSDENPDQNSIGQSRAARAYGIVRRLITNSKPSTKVLSTVANACGSLGLLQEARVLLKTIHKRVLLDDTWDVQENTNTIQFLHPTLLRYCADQGNVTLALRLCDDIQSFSKKMMIKEKERYNNKNESSVEEDNVELQIPYTNNVILDEESSFGMKLEEWKSVLLAASKSAHWRVCLTTLQFIRPYIEATHPSLAKSDADRNNLSMKYSKLEVIIKETIKCLALRSQYGWIVRVIDDWIEWSGRRPPRVAVLAGIRSLSSRGRGEEVITLVQRCVTMPLPKVRGNDPAYESMIYVGAITSLHNEGLYDTADDAFVDAISRGALPLDIVHEQKQGQVVVTLDLHGMNVAVAHSAVRIALQQEFINSTGIEHYNKSMIIVTGRGLNSALRMRPILRPEVQRMLLEEFYPPLNTMSIPGNMGALSLSSDDIASWSEHQKTQRSVRMLAIAGMLSEYSDRVKNTLSHAVVATSSTNNVDDS